MALASDKEKIDWLLKRVSIADVQINVRVVSACPVVYFAIKMLLFTAN